MSLVGCVAHDPHSLPARHGLGAVVAGEADWWLDRGAGRQTRADIRVQPRRDPEVEAGSTEVVEHCLVHDTLRREAEVVIAMIGRADAEASG